MKRIFLILITLLLTISARAQSTDSISSGTCMQCDSLRQALSRLQEQIEPLQRHLQQCVTPMLTLSHDTTPLISVDIQAIDRALAEYQKALPILEYYDPYPEEELTTAYWWLGIVKEQAEAVQQASALLSTPGLTEQMVLHSMAELNATKSRAVLDMTDLDMIDRLYIDIQGDYNTRLKVKALIKKLRTWHVIPNEHIARQAYTELIKPFYEENGISDDTIPEAYVQLCRVMTPLTDVTKNYNSSKYRNKISGEGSFKSWLDELSRLL